MPKILYNEGRVVGYSAYELYVKHALSIDPNREPASELEWLSSSIAMGSSMLLRVGTDNTKGPHAVEIPFPNNTILCAANTIIGSFFIGKGYIPEGTADNKYIWPTKVIDYGKLISNTDASSPATSIPPTPVTSMKEDWSKEDRTRLKEYMKIIDGIIIQPGNWSDNENKPPTKEFSPKLNTYPRLRLYFKDAVKAPFFILLTGFTFRTVISGVSGLDTSVNTESPQNGDFLGPATYPWANKVVFSIPPSFANYTLTNNYSRKLPSNGPDKVVDTSSIIDMSTTDPGVYYSKNDSESRIDINVTELNTIGDGASVLTIYQRNEILTPALYGAKITNEGSTYLSPIDINAPGTIKLYHGKVYSDTSKDTTEVTKAKTLQHEVPSNSAFIRDSSDHVIYEINQNTEQTIPVSKVYTSPLTGALVVTELTYPLLMVEGTYARSGVICKDSKSNAEISSRYVDFNHPDTWYIEFNGKRIEGTEVAKDPLQYCGASPIVYKRITGRLSDEIRNQCGYEYDSEVFGYTPLQQEPEDWSPNYTKYYTKDNKGNYINIAKSDSGAPNFSPGLYYSGNTWHRATRDMMNQIPESERSNYYYIIPGSWKEGANNIIWPVRKSDNMLDVTVRYGFNIIVNGKIWNIPPFYNNANKNTCSDYLGSWWDKHQIKNPDGNSAEHYNNKWAKIYIPGHPHPTAKSRLDETNTGQVYYSGAMLPADINGVPYEEYADQILISRIFSKETLVADGILPQYCDISLLKFLRIALYTDMGTGQPLPPDHGNILQPQLIYGNTSNPANGDDIKFKFRLTVANTEATSGKTQLMELPKDYLDSSNDDALGVVTQTGELQALSLSMADENNTPYILSGTKGTLDKIRDDTLHWDDMVDALSKNKSIDILGPNLRSLKTSMINMEDGDYIISIRNGNISLGNIAVSNDSGTINYLKFPGGMKLYITDGVSPGTFGSPKKGDIGIGW